MCKYHEVALHLKVVTLLLHCNTSMKFFHFLFGKNLDGHCRAINLGCSTKYLDVLNLAIDQNFVAIAYVYTVEINMVFIVDAATCTQSETHTHTRIYACIYIAFE